LAPLIASFPSLCLSFFLFSFFFGFLTLILQGALKAFFFDFAKKKDAEDEKKEAFELLDGWDGNFVVGTVYLAIEGYRGSLLYVLRRVFSWQKKERIYMYVSLCPSQDLELGNES
jgi:hypothetical protein